MRERGRLTEWNDDRGFGFIAPLSGGSRIFVHISEFPSELRRPMVTDLVAYDVGHDERNRPRAQDVEFMTPAHARHEDHAHPLSVFEVAFPAAFVLVLVVLTRAGKTPSAVLALYLIASVLAFGMYWRDKSAALNGRWRTSEAALLGIAAVGGWPGAFLARHVFRHKTRKQPFRTYFWLVVAVNCAFLGVVIFELGQSPG